MKKAGLWILILGILLVAAVAFIVITSVISPAIVNRQTTIYNLGAQEGYTAAIVDVAQGSLNCQIVPLNIENQTINLVDTSCVSQA
jgi:hypothetical protein